MMMHALLMMLATATPATVDLSVADRQALVFGLKARVGGDFILTGVAGADGLCRSAATCVTVQSLVADGRITTGGPIRTIDDLATKVSLSDDAPAAVVAIRGAERLSRNEIQVFASIYNPATKQWQGKAAVLRSEGSATLPKTFSRKSRIVRWRDAPEFDL